jgi:hypothetical protein
MTRVGNVRVWAKKYGLEDVIETLIKHGFDSLESIAAIEEKDLDAMGIKLVGTKKKILTAAQEIKKKAEKMRSTGESLADLSNTAYLPDSSTSTSTSTSASTSTGTSTTTGTGTSTTTGTDNKATPKTSSGQKPSSSSTTTKQGKQRDASTLGNDKAGLLQSYTNKNYYIHSVNTQVKLTELTNDADKVDATWIIKAVSLNHQKHSHNHQKGVTSLESSSQEGYYLRHKDNFEVYLEKYDDSNLFTLDASFQALSGLADPQGFSYESINYPNYYLRQQNFVLFLQKNDGSDSFKSDATFSLIDPK